MKSLKEGTENKCVDSCKKLLSEQKNTKNK